MASKKVKRAKTTSLPSDLIQAVEIFLVTQRSKNGNTAKDFSAACAQGLRLLLSHNRTSVPKLLGQLNGMRSSAPAPSSSN